MAEGLVVAAVVVVPVVVSASAATVVVVVVITEDEAVVSVSIETVALQAVKPSHIASIRNKANTRFCSFIRSSESVDYGQSIA